MRHNRRVADNDLLDDINRAIVQLLQHDGRKSFASIAKQVGLSEAAVRQRVKRLVTADVIQIVAVTDQMQMGYARAAMVTINVDGDVDAVRQHLQAIDEVDYLVSTAGGIDLFAEVAAVDDSHLFDIVNRIRSVPGVRQAQTYIYFKIHKQTYHWGS